MNRLTRFVNTIFGTILGVDVPADKTIFSIIIDWLAAMYAEFVLIVMRRVESDFAPKLKPLIDKAEKTGKVPPEVQPLLDEIKNPSKPIAAMLGQSIGGTATGSIVGSSIGPFLMLLQYEMQRVANQARWDPATGLAIVYRRPDAEGLVHSDLRDQGWTEDRIQLLKDVARTRLVEDLCVELRRRGIYTQEVYIESMKWLGYEKKEAEDYYTAREVWPGVSDLVRMAVREAFTPEIAEKFGQYQDLPPEYMARAKQIGLSEDFAKAFWAAHWDLPSAQMGFEMLHRGIINQDDLKLLLRALDIMPYWRDRLIKLSYVPFTRVDIRRMHKVGILTEAQVFQAYKDIGYDDDKAQDLTKFTIELNKGSQASTEKDLAKSEVVSLYKKRILTEAEAKARLAELKYGAEEIGLILDLAEWTADAATKELTLSQVKDLYIKGIRSQAEVREFLRALRYSDQAINNLFSLWDWEKPQDYRLPARTELNSFYELGILDEAAWRREMAKLNFESTVISWYWTELQAELVEKGGGTTPEKIKNLTLSQLKQLYTLKLRTRTEITPFLTAMGYNADQIKALYDLWDWEKPISDRIPSRTDFDAFLAAGIIDLNTWSDGYTTLGYDMAYQEMYFALLVEKGKVAG